MAVMVQKGEVTMKKRAFNRLKYDVIRLCAVEDDHPLTAWQRECIKRLGRLAIRKHMRNYDDEYYSCALAFERDIRERFPSRKGKPLPKCDCGASSHNMKVKVLLRSLLDQK
jgi:hypothetical protein